MFVSQATINFPKFLHFYLKLPIKLKPSLGPDCAHKIAFYTIIWQMLVMNGAPLQFLSGPIILFMYLFVW